MPAAQMTGSFIPIKLNCLVTLAAGCIHKSYYLNLTIRREVMTLWLLLHGRHNARFKPLGITRITPHYSA